MIHLEPAERLAAQAVLHRAGTRGAQAQPDDPDRVVADLLALGLLYRTPKGGMALAETDFGALAPTLVLEMYRALTWIQPLSGLAGGPFAATIACVRPSPVAMGSTATPGGLRIVSGCAASEAEATLRCIAEGIERHALQYAQDDEQRSGRSDPPAGGVQAEQLLPRPWIEANGRCLAPIARPWLAADWTSDGRPRLVPLAHVLLGYPGRAEEGWPPADTNGAACGADPLDATRRALLELIERDAVGIWWHRRQACPSFAVASLGDPWLQAVSDWLWGHGRCLWFLDIASDLGVPVVAAVSCDRSLGRLILGTGAGATPADAARAALAEHCLMLVNTQAIQQRSSDPGHERTAATRLLNWHLRSSAHRQPHLFPDPTTPERPAPRSLSLPDLLDRLACCGFYAMSFRRGGPSAPLSVVRCVVPGLATRGFCPAERMPSERKPLERNPIAPAARQEDDDERFPY
jgi:thiazole/oxazole-forming peptide maturase SagD family component